MVCYAYRKDSEIFKLLKISLKNPINRDFDSENFAVETAISSI